MGLLNKSAQLSSENHEIYYFEPFYQLMRQTLWAEQMIAHNETEITKADDYIHLHVIPIENYELLDNTYRCSSQGLEATWSYCIKCQKNMPYFPLDLFLHRLTRFAIRNYYYILIKDIGNKLFNIFSFTGK
jgi:hypothetical protein